MTGSVKPRGRAWAVTAFLLGIGVSIAGNVAHTWHPSEKALKAAHSTAEEWKPEIGAQLVAAFFPLALLLCVEILSRVDWPRSPGWSMARYGGAGVVAAVAAVVSYRHMAGLLDAYGEDGLTSAIGPAAVDGLMVVASFALLAIGRQTATEPVVQPVVGHVAEPVAEVADPVADDPADTTPEPAKNGHPQTASATGSTADQATPHDLETAVRSASADGVSVRGIAKSFGISRHLANKIVKAGTEPAAPATVAANGHRPTTDDHTTPEGR